jgi:hypothetical protein
MQLANVKKDGHVDMGVGCCDACPRNEVRVSSCGLEARGEWRRTSSEGCAKVACVASGIVAVQPRAHARRERVGIRPVGDDDHGVRFVGGSGSRYGRGRDQQEDRRHGLAAHGHDLPITLTEAQINTLVRET